MTLVEAYKNSRVTDRVTSNSDMKLTDKINSIITKTNKMVTLQEKNPMKAQLEIKIQTNYTSPTQDRAR